MTAIVQPKPILCTDNAAMIATVGYYALWEGRSDGLDLETFAMAPLGS